MQFKNQKHERVYRRLIRGLQSLGYEGNLIQESYDFPDLFLPDTPIRHLPAVAFGREPPSYDTACIALVFPDHKNGIDLISECRAVGAPVALEVDDDCVTQWKVSADTNRIVKWDKFHASSLSQKLKEKKDEWLPDIIVRGKNVFAKLAPRQLDFIDLGLIPALEKQVRDKLDRLLREVINTAISVHKKSTGSGPDMQRLFRLVFRLIAAKLLADRRVSPFRSVDRDTDPKIILTRVSRYYSQTEPVIEDAQTIAAVAGAIWGAISFQNLSVDALADIYENTLVDEQVRRKLGTHSTPSSVARYIVSRLINEENISDIHQIVEPCSGHAIFLVAALERLRDLLPSQLPPHERHRFFVRTLRGFEQDAFALEIGKLCLMLADFPFPDGWHLVSEDVFASQKFDSALSRSDIVLCNPPFEDFSEEVRQYYPNRRSVQKPAELLHRVLDELKPSGTLGFVLPRQFTDGRAYRDVRQRIADRYKSVEIVSLPDRVFHISKLQTVLLVAKEPCTGHTQVNLSYADVSDADRKRFLLDYEVSRRGTKRKSKANFVENAKILILGDLWERLRDLPKLGAVTEMHRGIEWKPPFTKDKYLSAQPKEGFAKGLRQITDEYCSFQAPPALYLSTRIEDQRGNAFHLPWNKPKVIANAVRVSRGHWRLAAFPDEEGLMASQSFYGIWPSSGWTIRGISAVLNGPIANAFISTHEGQQHNRKQVLAQIPLPYLTEAQHITLDRLVEEYRGIMNASNDFFSNTSNLSLYEEVLRRTCLQIDAIILKAYNLPPRIERNLLDFFRGHQRRVPFPFTEYFPVEFKPTIPLWMYISDDYQRCRADYLISRIPKITDPVLVDALTEVE